MQPFFCLLVFLQGYSYFGCAICSLTVCLAWRRSEHEFLCFCADGFSDLRLQVVSIAVALLLFAVLVEISCVRLLGV